MGILCLPDDRNDLESANKGPLHEQRMKYSALQDKFKADISEEIQNTFRKDSSSCALMEMTVLESDDEIEMDPLSHFLVEKEVQERRQERFFRRQERDLIRQKRGFEETNMDDSTYSLDDCSLDPCEVLSVITKDLQRLQLDHHSCFLAHKACRMPYSLAIEQRCKQMKELLYIHARQYPRVGYQQGMHDLASLLVLVMEQDVFETNETSIFCNEHFILHDSYSMLEYILTQLQPAYGACQSACETPVEDMVQDILSKLQFVAGESSLYLHLTQMNLPPELFCARWVRLMFSREVVDWKEALTMWDIFLDASTKHPSILSLEDAARYTRPGITNPLVMGQCTLMQVLVTCAASYIWLHRAKILSDTPSGAFRYLVNLAPTKSSGRLLSTLLSSLRRVQYGILPTSKEIASSPRCVSTTFRLGSSMRRLLQGKDSLTKLESSLVVPSSPLLEMDGSQETLTRSILGSSIRSLLVSSTKGEQTPSDLDKPISGYTDGTTKTLTEAMIRARMRDFFGRRKWEVPPPPPLSEEQGLDSFPISGVN